MNQKINESDKGVSGLSDIATVLLERDYSGVALDFLKNTTRTLNYFKEEGLIPDRPKKSNFTFIDLVWLRIVYQLREVGVNTSLIRSLKEVAFAPFDDRPFVDSLREHQEIITTFWKGKIKDLPENARDTALMMLDAFWNHSGVTILIKNNIIHWITFIIIQKVPGELHLYPDGKVDFYYLDNIHPKPKPFIHKTFISISLTEILAFYLSKNLISTVLMEQYFTAEEIKIIEIVRTESCKSIKVSFKGNVVDLIEVEKELKLNASQKLSEILLQNAYEDVSIKTQKGKIIVCKKITKTKPTKK